MSDFESVKRYIDALAGAGKTDVFSDFIEGNRAKADNKDYRDKIQSRAVTKLKMTATS